MRVFHFVIKKIEESPETGFLFFFQWFWYFLKYFNSNHNLPSYSLFSKCFLRFFYLGVHRGTSVFSWLFFFHTSSRVWLALALTSHLPPFDGKTLKNCACSAKLGLLNETKGSCFPLSCLSSYQNGWQEQTFFFYKHINIQIRRFFSELVESKSCGKYCLIIIRIGTNTALLAFFLGM